MATFLSNSNDFHLSSFAMEKIPKIGFSAVVTKLFFGTFNLPFLKNVRLEESLTVFIYLKSYTKWQFCNSYFFLGMTKWHHYFSKKNVVEAIFFQKIKFQLKRKAL